MRKSKRKKGKFKNLGGYFCYCFWLVLFFIDMFPVNWFN